MPLSVQTVDGFFRKASALRRHYDQRFADPRSTAEGRFIWDYWHVPGQYTALRTPAWQFFPEGLYSDFHNALVQWGRRNLGCHDISPPWMSCYVEGCGQELHGDLPHGPFAFVYSLTPWEERKFRGGETLLLRDEVLDWWRDFAAGRAVEQEQLLRAVEPQFNRLVVFDPRIPHGVRRVEGTHDVRHGRLVVHGWFVQPRPFIEGALEPQALQEALDTLGPVIGEALDGLAPLGLLSLQLRVSAAGRVTKVAVLTDTLRTATGQEHIPAFIDAMVTAARALQFEKQAGPSVVTLPLVFDI